MANFHKGKHGKKVCNKGYHKAKHGRKTVCAKSKRRR